MKKNITYGKKYSPAMEITEQEAADAYFEELVKHNLKCRRACGEPPIFGSISKNGAPTPREALAAGMVAAKSGIKQAAKLFQ